MALSSIQSIQDAIAQLDCNAPREAESLEDLKLRMFLELMNIDSALNEIALYLDEREA